LVATDTSEATVDTLWRTLGIVQASIQFADAKGGTILLVDGVVATLASTRLVDAQALLHRNYLLLGIIVVGAVLWLFSAYFAIQCVRPRLGKEEATSLLYFAHIARKYPHDYKHFEEAILDTLSRPEQIVSQISHQIWSNSHVAVKKHADARRSLDFLVMTVALALIVGVKVMVGSMLH
jgi:Family of unknown function (DUF5706)